MNIYIRILIIIFLGSSILIAQNNKIGDVSDGSRAIPVHLIKLIDQDSSVVRPGDEPMLPFSMKNTCGECHDYSKIRQGWHFNAGDSNIVSGRKGHPWIFSDQNTGTQIPVSFRGWKGTFRPEEIDLNGLEYLQLFGRQMPGGSIGDNENLRKLDNIFRWRVSGDMEINCLSCHDAEFAHDQAAYAGNITKHNFRWAATASSAIANGFGNAKEMPDNYDIYQGTAPDLAKKIPPHVKYDLTRFDDKNQVLLDVVRKIPDENCYFCHSSKMTGDGAERWISESDVHLNAGLKCVDCHRNGLNHDMIRGYDANIDENADADSHIKQEFSCKGCHMSSGRLGAPKPEHPGIPPVHFEKLTCTTCHSGTMPGPERQNIKTSMAHALGVHGTNKSDSTLPHVITPVFSRQKNGIIAPQNLMWPSYWALQSTDTIVPVSVKEIYQIVSAFVENDDSTGTGDWLEFNENQIVAILDTLRMSAGENNIPVYISGGQLYSLLGDSNLVAETHMAANPYSWPVGHNVRPAIKSLGSNGCQDCHSTSSDFYYGEITIDSPVLGKDSESIQNIDLMELNRAGTWIFSSSFLFRPWLKTLIIICTAILVLVLLIYVSKALRYVTENLGK